MLESLVQADSELGLSDLARRVGLDKSAVYRLLLVMVSAGYVVQDPASRKYRPSSKLISLGSAVLSKVDLREAVRPFLTRLVESTKYTAHLAALADGRREEVVYLDQAARTSAAIVVNISVGRVAPSHCSATGKAILAFLPAEQRSPWQDVLPSYTARTITSGSELQSHLEEIRRQGYAVDNQEYRDGLRCLAAPVRNHTGEVFASIGISGPASDLKEEDVPRLATIVMETANEASAALGFASVRGERDTYPVHHWDHKAVRR